MESGANSFSNNNNDNNDDDNNNNNNNFKETYWSQFLD